MSHRFFKKLDFEDHLNLINQCFAVMAHFFMIAAKETNKNEYTKITAIMIVRAAQYLQEWMILNFEKYGMQLIPADSKENVLSDISRENVFLFLDKIRNLNFNDQDKPYTELIAEYFSEELILKYEVNDSEFKGFINGLIISKLEKLGLR